jgi:hypothetical protein
MTMRELAAVVRVAPAGREAQLRRAGLDELMRRFPDRRPRRG